MDVVWVFFCPAPSSEAIVGGISFLQVHDNTMSDSVGGLNSKVSQVVCCSKKAVLNSGLPCWLCFCSIQMIYRTCVFIRFLPFGN